MRKRELKDEDYVKSISNVVDLLFKARRLEKTIKILKEENQHIFANVNDDELLRSNAMNWAEKNELQDRINKAIEYIAENKHEMYSDQVKDLLDILRGKE